MTTIDESSPRHAAGPPAAEADSAFAHAERRLFALYNLAPQHDRLALADPALDVATIECGAGAPVLFVHGSGMCAATWAPLLAHLPDRRAIALDLPGFGASAAYSYAGRSLREHAVAQITSALDALDLRRAVAVGTSLGAMWALSAAHARPERISSVVALGMPAVALPGLRRDPFFTLLTTPGIGRLVARGPAPKNAAAARKGMRRAVGTKAAAALPDEFFDVVRLAMAQDGWGTAMHSHLNRAMRRGRPRPGNAFTDDELRSIGPPVSFIWGDEDVYGSVDVGRRAADLLPAGTLHVVSGGHAPFLDEPRLCAEVIRAAS